MEKVRTITLSKSVFADNDRQAELLREYLRSKGVLLVNVMSSPGAGKTSTLIALIRALAPEYRIGVMEADIDSDVDAVSVAEQTGCKSIQLHTGGMCHLDADMSRQGLRELECEGLDAVILENVGNLVCPAEFDAGAVRNVAILSVPEGHDKPLKYPLMFETCQAVLINKIDAMPAFDFDLEKVKEYIAMRNPGAKVFPVSARTGEGFDAWTKWLAEEIKNWIS